MTSSRLWIDSDRYLAIHDATIMEFDHFIEQDSIATMLKNRKGASQRGRLRCVGGTYLHVNILFERNHWSQVRVARYTFHAGIAAPTDRPTFRYDNAHTYEREDQPDPHHKHRYDIATGREIVPPEWIGADNQPTLRSVLAELQQWWLDVGRTLDP